MTTPELEPKDGTRISKFRNPIEHAYMMTNTTSRSNVFEPLSPQELDEWDKERTRIGDPYFEYVGDGQQGEAEWLKIHRNNEIVRKAREGEI